MTLGMNCGSFSRRAAICSSESWRFMVRASVSISMMSPSSMMAIGPPAAASGETWPIQRPRVPPEKRPSVMRAALMPAPLIAEVGASISCIPGPPFGPSYLITTTSPSLILPPRIADRESSWVLKTRAVPVNWRISGSTPAVLTTAPSGAMLP